MTTNGLPDGWWQWAFRSGSQQPALMGKPPPPEPSRPDPAERPSIGMRRPGPPPPPRPLLPEYWDGRARDYDREWALIIGGFSFAIGLATFPLIGAAFQWIAKTCGS